jgi:hypothetical protein
MPAGEAQRRVAAGDDVEDHEHEQRDGEEHDHQAHHPAQDERPHQMIDSTPP